MPAHAGTADGPFQARVKLLANCTVTASDVDFGTLNQVTGAEVSSGEVRVFCSKGTPFIVSYNATVVRPITNGFMRQNLSTGILDQIPYRLQLSATSGTGAGLAPTNAITFNVSATITAAISDATPGNYRHGRSVFVVY